MEKNIHNPIISVIVPVYKVEPYLRQCIDSILAQTFTDFELILVDDGSPDNCGVICDEYAAKDSRVVTIHQENAGVSVARNTGLDIMQGRYVYFVDSDDVLHPLTLELHYRNLIDHNADVSKSFPYIFANSDDFVVNKLNQPHVKVVTGREACLELYDPNGWYFTVWDKLYKSYLFDDVRFPVGMKYEDEAIIYKIYYAAERVVEINEELYFYRKNPDGIMGQSFSIKWYDRVKVFSERASFFAERNEHELSERAQALADIFQAKYAIRTRKLHMYSDVSFEYKMSVLSALMVIKRNCSEDNFQYWLNYMNPLLLKPYLYTKKIMSIFKKKRFAE